MNTFKELIVLRSGISGCWCALSILNIFDPVSTSHPQIAELTHPESKRELLKDTARDLIQSVLNKKKAFRTNTIIKKWKTNHDDPLKFER